MVKADWHSIDHLQPPLYKIFKTGSIDVIKDCQSCFVIDMPRCVLKRRQDKFILRYISAVNGFANFAKKVVILN